MSDVVPHASRLALRPSCVAAITALLAIAPATAQAPAKPGPQPPVAQATQPPAGPATAQPDTTRPKAAARMVRIFDFEERDENPGEVPRYWYRSQDSADSPRPDFPAWNRPRLFYTADNPDQPQRVKRGVGSVMLPTQGGCTSLILGKGVIPVFEGADYVVHASIHTEDLRHARAGVVTRLLDASGKALDGTQVTSRLVLNEEGWTNVSVAIDSDKPGASYLQIELVLLQPRAQQAGGNSTDTPFRIVEEDRDGAAYFDDVAVLQLPRIELFTESAGNITAQPSRPRLHALVRDMAGERLTQTIEVLDASGTVVDRTTGPLTGGGAEQTWQPTLPRLGWYRARLSLTNSQNLSVGGAVVDLLWTPSTGSPGAARRLSTIGAERGRFGLALNSLSDKERASLPAVVRSLGIGSVVLPAWSLTLTPETARPQADALQLLASTLIADGCAPTIAMGPVPAGITSEGRFDAGDAWPVLTGDREKWIHYADDVFDRLGARIPAWQIGRAGDDRAFWRDWSTELARLQRDLDGYIPGSTIAVPASIHQAWDASRLQHTHAPVQLVVRVPAETTAVALRSAVANWTPSLNTGRDDFSVRFALESLDVSQFGPAASAEQIARQMVECWRLMGPNTEGSQPHASLVLSDPWFMSKHKRPQVRPLPATAAWEGVMQRLQGRRIVGEFPVTEGVRCYIIAPMNVTDDDRPGALVLWNESAPPAAAKFEGAVGRGPLQTVDIYGNTAPLPLIHTRTGSSVVHLDLTGAPVFIEGVDVPLVRFLSMVRIEPPFLEATGEVLDRTIVLQNPWPASISGTVSIVEPGGYVQGPKDRSWRIVPRSSPFSIPPGKTAQIPFTVSFSPTEEAGYKPFLLSLDVTADAPYGVVETTRQVEVGLKEYSVELRAAASGNDAAIEAIVTNTSTRTLTLEVTALAPGQPRSRAVIANLPPGRQVARRFAYPGLRGSLGGQKVIVSVTDTESRLRLNRSAQIP